MIARLMGNEVANAALVLALSGTVAALVSNGPGRVSFERAVSGVLSNPVPRREAPGVGEAFVPASLKAAA